MVGKSKNWKKFLLLYWNITKKKDYVYVNYTKETIAIVVWYINKNSPKVSTQKYPKIVIPIMCINKKIKNINKKLQNTQSDRKYPK